MAWICDLCNLSVFVSIRIFILSKCFLFSFFLYFIVIFFLRSSAKVFTVYLCIIFLFLLHLLNVFLRISSSSPDLFLFAFLFFPIPFYSFFFYRSLENTIVYTPFLIIFVSTQPSPENCAGASCCVVFGCANCCESSFVVRIAAGVARLFSPCSVFYFLLT